MDAEIGVEEFKRNIKGHGGGKKKDFQYLQLE
jgi:hypothetical protein